METVPLAPARRLLMLAVAASALTAAPAVVEAAAVRFEGVVFANATDSIGSSDVLPLGTSVSGQIQWDENAAFKGNEGDPAGPLRQSRYDDPSLTLILDLPSGTETSVAGEGGESGVTSDFPGLNGPMLFGSLSSSRMWLLTIDDELLADLSLPSSGSDPNVPHFALPTEAQLLAGLEKRPSVPVMTLNQEFVLTLAPGGGAFGSVFLVSGSSATTIALTEVTAVPEPVGLATLALGGILLRRRR